MEELTVQRMAPEDAPRIVDCIERVYGQTYARGDFYDADRLAEQMRLGTLCSVAAVDGDGRLVGHMAMSRYPGATNPELGNSVVDPVARGQGLIWKIGAELVAWSMEFGDTGFLDYPTTDHHIMQRQSVTTGCETGLMLGYIPAVTDGKVRSEGSVLRAGATIVYHPYPGRLAPRARSFLPEYCDRLVSDMAIASGAQRDWRPSKGIPKRSETIATSVFHDRRNLERLTVDEVGGDLDECLASLEAHAAACRQIDFQLSDPCIENGVRVALDIDYWFCGWLPGFTDADVFRLQKVDRSVTQMAPAVVNPTAQSLLDLIPDRAS